MYLFIHSFILYIVLGLRECPRPARGRGVMHFTIVTITITHSISIM